MSLAGASGFACFALSLFKHFELQLAAVRVKYFSGQKLQHSKPELCVPDQRALVLLTSSSEPGEAPTRYCSKGGGNQSLCGRCDPPN